MLPQAEAGDAPAVGGEGAVEEGPAPAGGKGVKRAKVKVCLAVE